VVDCSSDITYARLAAKGLSGLYITLLQSIEHAGMLGTAVAPRGAATSRAMTGRSVVQIAIGEWWS
jgi:hypothetical protein